MSAPKELLDSLIADLALEHAAILQYIVQGRQLRESPLANDVMEMAREEMWHFEWLAEAITARGGQPSAERGAVYLSATMVDGMEADVHSEQMALDHYAETLARIGDTDPDLRALIERIVDDEHHHHAAFGKLAARVRQDGEETHAAHPLIAPADIPHIAPMMGLEYEGLLRHLMSKYGCDACEQAERYFELAIEDMRHAAWAAGYLVGFGTPQAPPDFAEQITPVTSAAEAFDQADSFERHAEQTYSALASAAANPELKTTIERAAKQHAFHRGQLDRMGGDSHI